jgi:hypothetical protein
LTPITVWLHPFADGNGRTARLLMNLLLMRGGYPPVAVRPVDRKGLYRRAGVRIHAKRSEAFQNFMRHRLDATLEEYLTALQEALPPESLRDKPGGSEPNPWVEYGPLCNRGQLLPAKAKLSTSAATQRTAERGPASIRLCHSGLNTSIDIAGADRRAGALA